MLPSNVTLNASSHYHHDFHIERGKLHPQRITKAMKRGFGGIIYRAEDVWYVCCNGSDVDDAALGFDEERTKLLAHAHHRDGVCIEYVLHLFEIDV